MVEAVARRWHEPDHGIWEARLPPRHHVYSKVMCWMTVDRALHVVAPARRRGPARSGSDAARPDRRRTCWSTAGTRASARTRSRTATTEMDASSLWIGLSGLLPDDDPRFLATVLAIEAELRSGPVVYRYRWDDGLPGREGGFHICTAWLIEAYLRTGRRADAEELFEQMVDTAGPDRAAARAVRPARRARAGQPPAGVQPPRADPLRPAAGRHAQGLTAAPTADVAQPRRHRSSAARVGDRRRRRSGPAGDGRWTGRRTTSPMTTTAGGRRPAVSHVRRHRASVDRSTRCVAGGALLHHRGRGVRRAGRARSRVAAIAGRFFSPIRTHQRAAQPGQRRPVAPGDVRVRPGRGARRRR